MNEAKSLESSNVAGKGVMREAQSLSAAVFAVLWILTAAKRL